MVNINKLADKAVQLRIAHKNFGVMGDIKPEFKDLYIDPKTSRVYFTYYTYYRYHWDTNLNHKASDIIFIISGPPNKLNYRIGTQPTRMGQYRRKRIKDGFIQYSGQIDVEFPEISDIINKVLMLVELKS